MVNCPSDCPRTTPTSDSSGFATEPSGGIARSTSVRKDHVGPEIAAESANYFDLEDPRHIQRLTEPLSALENLRGIVVIDEVEQRPDLFPVLRVLADREPLPARFLILGSASPALLRQSSESLTGRIECVLMGGLSLDEVGLASQRAHWVRGGFPLSFLALDDEASVRWRRKFVQTFLERDLPQFGFAVPALTMHRFWSMVAHYHGQIWNAAEPARSLGISETTVRRHLDLLGDLFMVRQFRLGMPT